MSKELREQLIELLNNCIIGESVSSTSNKILSLFGVDSKRVSSVEEGKSYLCPLCSGSGREPFPNKSSSSSYEVCSICSGSKVLHPTINPLGYIEDDSIKVEINTKGTTPIQEEVPNKCNCIKCNPNSPDKYYNKEETPSEGDCLSEELRAKHNISLGVQHIFDSGVNEIRVQGLIDLSVNQALSKERERMIEVAAKRFGYRNALELKKDLTNKK